MSKKEKDEKAAAAKKQADGGGGKRAAWRAASRARRKNHYATNFMKTEPNRKRKMRRHLKRNPFDDAAQADYKKHFGIEVQEVTSKGRKLVHRREREIRRLERLRAAPVPVPPAEQPIHWSQPHQGASECQIPPT